MTNAIFLIITENCNYGSILKCARYEEIGVCKWKRRDWEYTLQTWSL